MIRPHVQIDNMEDVALAVEAIAKASFFKKRIVNPEIQRSLILSVTKEIAIDLAEAPFIVDKSREAARIAHSVLEELFAIIEPDILYAEPNFWVDDDDWEEGCNWEDYAPEEDDVKAQSLYANDWAIDELDELDELDEIFETLYLEDPYDHSISHPTRSYPSADSGESLY